MCMQSYLINTCYSFMHFLAHVLIKGILWGVGVGGGGTEGPGGQCGWGEGGVLKGRGVSVAGGKGEY